MKKKIQPVKRKGVAQRTGLHAVCLIGWEGPRAAAFGDNQGVWPVKVVTSTKEMMAAERSDLESPVHRVIVLEYVLVATAEHAKRLKAALDEVLLGEQEGQMNGACRHRWRNCVGCFEENDEHQRALWWSIVLDEAQRLLRGGATEFAIYETAESAFANGYGDD